MARKGSITDQDIDFIETWENIATRQNAIIRLDARGDERQEIISGRRNFMLSSEERIITENKILDPKNDPFKNGDFRPVMVPDSVTIESNPNALSDEEIVQMFTVSEVAWPQVLETVDSVATLRRMLDLADTAGDLSLKRYRSIEQRLVQVRGTDRPRLETKDEELRKFLDDSPAARKRGQGGRSADYRS
jgi:hypothetical protein